MSVSSTKSNAKLIEALHSTNWRQPVMYFHEDHGGPAVDKKKRSRNSSSSLDPGYHSAHQYGSVHEASPVRVASSSHSIADPFSDASGCVIKGSKDTHSSSVGLLSGIAVADDAVAVPAKRAASAFLDIHRSSRKDQRLRLLSSTLFFSMTNATTKRHAVPTTVTFRWQKL